MSKHDVRKNFVFKKEVVEHLEELAKKEAKSMTMVIQDLIEEKYQEISIAEKLEAVDKFFQSIQGHFTQGMTIQSIKAMKGDIGEKYGS